MIIKSVFWTYMALVLCPTITGSAQAQSDAHATMLSNDQIRAAAGDSVEQPGPLATDLKSAITQSNIQYAMRKVADWQIQHSTSKYNQDWTYAPLYMGLLATSTTTHLPKYRESVEHASENFKWKLWAARPFHADDEAIAQVYEALYVEHPDPVRIADARETFDRLLQQPDNAEKDLWWWCDALFMAPPALVKMSAITGDRKYIAEVDREWQLTTEHLYDRSEHLYFRDASFLKKTEANGKGLFWSRGNGWVLAGLANVLKALPANDPSRPRYVQLFREMAERIAGLQQPDGLWRTGLLDQTAYASPEISGSAFFTYALAWGINAGILKQAVYAPVIERAWPAMLKYVYQDGRLGMIQPIGAAPGVFSPSSNYVYGVGAFLLAGSEMDRYVAAHHRGAN